MVAAPRTAGEMTNVEADGLDVPCSDDAQQLSASSCETTRCLCESCESDLYIGQEALLQHCIRASGVAAQPAHTARLPPRSAKVSATADSRCLEVTTPVGCSTPGFMSNAVPQSMRTHHVLRRARSRNPRNVSATGSLEVALRRLAVLSTR
jgi:hypothetical protein